MIGPGHRWPLVLAPVYGVLRRIAATRAAAERLDVVTLAQMTTALVLAVERGGKSVRVVEVPEIRAAPAI